MKRRLIRKTGTEGPGYDPYSFVEATVELDEYTITLHSGLETRLQVGDLYFDLTNLSEVAMHEVFRVLTNMTLEEFEDYYLRINRPKCRICGRTKSFYEAEGHVGETFTICPKCNVVVRCDFNLAAVI